ncbi:MAG: hypothetical protein RLZZ157_1220, partial [Pseudomonadota bacterium]
MGPRRMDAWSQQSPEAKDKGPRAARSRERWVCFNGRKTQFQGNSASCEHRERHRGARSTSCAHY